MTFKARAGGSWVDVATTAKRRSSGAWVDVDFIKRRSGGAWTTVWQRISIVDNVANSVRPVGTATAQYELRSDGSLWFTSGYNTLVQSSDWLDFGASSSYEVRATLTSGTLDSGTTGSWLGLGTTRTWSISQGIVGVNSATITVEIRNAATATVVDTAYITIEAERG